MPMPAISPTTDIDSRVAQILGLDFTGDFTPGEYSSLLKEAMVRQHPDKGGDAEVFKLLSAERERTKNATEKFKVTDKKISADGFKKGSSIGGAQKVAADTTGASALALRGSSALSTDVKSLEPGEKGGDNLTEFQDIIEKIAGTVDSIHDTLTGQGKQDKVTRFVILSSVVFGYINTPT